MRARLSFATLVVGLIVLSAPAARAQVEVANDCVTPMGTTCWVAGVYNGDYSGMNDRQYIGPPAQESGGHPFTGVTDFAVNTTVLGEPDGTVNDVRVDIPAGLVSNPQATPKCSDAQLAADMCAAGTQLGIVKLESYEAGAHVYVGESVYNMSPGPGHCAGYVSDYAFRVALLGERVDICGSVRQQPPYNLYFTIVVPPGPALLSSTLIFWGVPGDSGHDPQRGWSCVQPLIACSPPAAGHSAPRGADFITNPTGCVPAGQISTLTLGSTDGRQSQWTSATPVPAIGCSSLSFAPKLTIGLAGRGQTAVGRHPSLTAALTQGNGQANVRSATVTLPRSLALDPYNSQYVCSVAAAASDSCPAATIVGRASATTPLLSEPLEGNVYLVQGIRINSRGQQIRTFPALLVALRGQAAIDLHGQSSVSPTSRLVTAFSALPDLPINSFRLTIDGGRRGILVVTGGRGRNICTGPQVTDATLFAQSGKRESTSIRMSTPCKAVNKAKHKRNNG